MSKPKSRIKNPKETLPVIEDSDNICALGVNTDGTNVCMTDGAIKKIANDLKNKGIDKNKLSSKKDILEEEKKQTQCNDEICVINNTQSLTHDEKNQQKKRIKPVGPAKSDKLLHNGNIDSVLSNLTEIFKDFYHMNFQMIDFAGEKDANGNWVQRNNYTITPTELGTINMIDDVIKQNKKTFGVVLNTDTRDKGGEHWFCLFCDFRSTPYTIEYFNSSGNRPYKQVDDWMNKTYIILTNANYKVEKKPLVGNIHQKDSETECGPYSLYYIYNRLNGIKAERFQENRITDAQMLEFRNMMFLDESKVKQG